MKMKWSIDIYTSLTYMVSEIYTDSVVIFNDIGQNNESCKVYQLNCKSRLIKTAGSMVS